MRYLLDTNAWIDYLRSGNARLIQRVQNQSVNIVLCSVVVAELVYGAYHGAPAYLMHNIGLLAKLRSRFASLPFDDAAAEQYGEVRAYLESQGTPIGPNDLMIAAIALANHLTLVTHNTAEFSRVPGLSLEDWQVAP